MASFTVRLFRKTQPPQDDKSHYEYLEQNLRSLEITLNDIVTAIGVVDGLSIRPTTLTATEAKDVCQLQL